MTKMIDDAPPAPPLRTWRPMAAWTAGLLLVLGLIWFAAAVVAPLWQVRAVLEQVRHGGVPAGEAVQLLGGSERAAVSVGLYLRLPNRIVGNRREACDLLLSCDLSGGKGLAYLLGDPDESTAALAGHALMGLSVEHGPEMASLVPALTKALAHKHPSVRGYSAVTLSRIGPEAVGAVPALISLLDDKDTGSEAIDALGNIGPGARAAEARLKQLFRDESGDKTNRAWAALALWKINGDAGAVVPTLVTWLGEGQDSAVQSAHVLGDIKPPARTTILALGKALEDERAGTAAAEALGRIGPEALPVLVAALASPDKKARSLAAGVLGVMGPGAAAALPALVRTLGDAERGVRAEAQQALGLIQPDALRLVPVLVEALSDPSPAVRVAAAAHLGMLGPQATEAVPPLIQALTDRAPKVQEAAAAALGDIGPGARSATPALVRTLHDGQPSVRLRAIEALMSIGPGAAEVVPHLAAAFHDDEYYVRIRAAAALARIGPPAIPALIEALGEPDRRARMAAVEALTGIGPRAAQAVPELIKALEKRDEPELCWIARALAEIGPAAKEALPALEKLALSDHEWQTRYAIEAALKKIKCEEPALQGRGDTGTR
jgi:HEAT repeat protein